MFWVRENHLAQGIYTHLRDRRKQEITDRINQCLAELQQDKGPDCP